MMTWMPHTTIALPVDRDDALLVGRVWQPEVDGPTPVVLVGDELRALDHRFPTVRDLLETENPADAAQAAAGAFVGGIHDVLDNSAFHRRDPSRPWLLAPHDLQAVKAAGVTFAVSMIERVIEERARGDHEAAAELRALIADRIGGDLRGVVPGSERAAELKRLLIQEGIWSQYLEVGIGPDAEIFTKGQPLSTVGMGAAIGVLSSSTWNNPEPEVALAVTSRGQIVGATLANDVNLRDIEGRSALLLGKAKDNNASGATGPFLRLFDGGFDLDVVRSMAVSVSVSGEDGFTMSATSDMSLISRDPVDLVGQLMGAHHQYPDGAVLMMGTMFAPIDDRGAPGMGFTHKRDDVVTIHSERLGSLVNVVRHSEECEPWTFGTRQLMGNLARRGLL
jgi:fumarylacetoacetate (FAA) hydrolase family protein